MSAAKAENLVLEQKLGEVARQGLAHADQQLLREVAEQLWYSAAVPNLAHVPPLLRPDVGYLVDKLARFNVLGSARKFALLDAVRPYLHAREKPANSVCRDPLAVEWGASSDFSCRLRELMPYQTRQYAVDRLR